MRRLLHITLGLLLCATVGLAGCGRKGPLEAPPRAESGARSGQSDAGGAPERPFILNGLFR